MNRIIAAGAVVMLLAGFAPVAAAAPDLSSNVLPLTEATAINNRAQVVGYAHLRSVDEHHAYLWQAGGMIDLGNLAPPTADPRDILTIPGDINNRGQVVGSSETANGTRPHAFLWQAGVMSDLGTLSGTASGATAINEAGQIVGSASITDVPYILHAVLWQDGTMTDLGTLGGRESWAADINNHGQIVGASDVASEPNTLVRHAVLWQAGVITDLGTLGGGVGSEASAINDRGQVIGRIEMASGPPHAFLWEAGTMIDLGALTVEGINERGQLVGYRGGAPILWQAGVVTDLELRSPIFGGRARQINERGQIVGTAWEAHDIHGVLWTK